MRIITIHEDRYTWEKICAKMNTHGREWAWFWHKYGKHTGKNSDKVWDLHNLFRDITSDGNLKEMMDHHLERQVSNENYNNI